MNLVKIIQQRIKRELIAESGKEGKLLLIVLFRLGKGLSPKQVYLILF
ncbi:MAG TPA: hypothetical protein GX004_03445 [Firmicutes bacterium]|nr:hypothetical protein [Bacillota bacterium]